MQSTFIQFISTLRDHDIRISTSESLDALKALTLIGYNNKTHLKYALASTLTKTFDEKPIFDYCFEMFFNGDRLKPNSLDEISNNHNTSALANEHELNHTTNQQPLNTQLNNTVDSPLAQILLNNNTGEINTLLATTSANNNPGEKLQYFTQKGQHTRRIMEAMGLKQLDENIEKLQLINSDSSNNIANLLKQRKQQLHNLTRQYVEEQFLLTANAQGRKINEYMLQNISLSTLESRHLKQLTVIINKMAKKLKASHARKIKQKNKGRLDVTKTLRHNVHHDSILFNTYWKKTNKTKPNIITLCDVSGSVASYTKFLLLFLYSLNDILPKIRSFCFSSRAGEITQLFNQYDAAQAIEYAFKQWGYGSSDYGQSFIDFSDLCNDDINNKTTVIILGDARNNYMDGRLDILKTIRKRAKTVIWLNPESQSQWGTGDSIIHDYQAACHTINECKSLRQLERIIDRLLQLIQ